MLITLGAFDGFHKGHAELLRVCRELSGDDWAVVTFEPHPASFMWKAQTLFTLKERELIRRVLGIPEMCVFRFDDDMMKLSPAKFWELLRERLNVDGLVVGSDFRFGHGRAGNAESLRELAVTDGLEHAVIVPVVDKPLYSSTTLRREVSAGNVDVAARILGYPFFMMSRVIHGDGRGKTLSFPTANLELDGGRVIPAYGVYSSAVLVNGAWHCGALSVGNNPTFHDVVGTRAEIFLTDFSGDIYGEELLVMILGRVRGICAFKNGDELALQIGRDVEECRMIYDSAMSEPDTKNFARKAETLFCRETLPPSTWFDPPVSPIAGSLPPLSCGHPTLPEGDGSVPELLASHA